MLSLRDHRPHHPVPVDRGRHNRHTEDQRTLRRYGDERYSCGDEIECGGANRNRKEIERAEEATETLSQQQKEVDGELPGVKQFGRVICFYGRLSWDGDSPHVP